jgi:superfamily II DNA or RNA helicase
MGIELRPYQRAAVDAAHVCGERDGSTLLVAATGLGKTTMFSAYVAERYKRTGKRVLVLAHREELVKQAAARIASQTGLDVGVEMADYRASHLLPQPIVVASVQTMGRESRLRHFEPDTFGTVVIDECHHSTSSTYRRIVEHFTGSVLLGVTATPDRTDKRGLGEVFGSVCYRYDIADGIDDGWLVPIRQLSIFCDKLDLSAAKTAMGDISEKDLQQAIGAEEVLHQIAVPLVREAGARQTIVFCPGVRAAHDLAGVMARYTSAPIGIVFGAMPPAERKATLDAFAAGSLQYVVNCAVLTEGYDAPNVSCVAVARPTKSRSLYTQMVGRGLRLAEGKKDCLVLDFHGNAGRHKLVCPADVLSGEPLDDKMREKVRAMCATGEEPVKAMERVKEEELAEARRIAATKGVKTSAKYTATEVDPFSILGVRPSNTSGPEMSEAQRHLLERAGIKTGNITSRDASRTIEAIIDRRKRGLCTMKQATLLARFGYSTALTMEQATVIIDRLSANGWRRV